MSNVAKAIAACLVASVGTGITTALALLPESGTAHLVLVCVAAGLTPLGATLATYAVPNVLKPGKDA